MDGSSFICGTVPQDLILLQILAQLLFLLAVRAILSWVRLFRTTHTRFSQKSLPRVLHCIDSDWVTHQSLSKALRPRAYNILIGWNYLPPHPHSSQRSQPYPKHWAEPQGEGDSPGKYGGVHSSRTLERYWVADWPLNFYFIFWFHGIVFQSLHLIPNHLFLSLCFQCSHFMFLKLRGIDVGAKPHRLQCYYRYNSILHTCILCNPLQQSAVERNFTFLSSPSSKFEGNTYVIQ